MSNDDVIVYFATNRNVSGSDDHPRFGDGFNRRRPQVFRVGEAVVERVSRRRSEYRFRRARLEREDLSSPDPRKVELGSETLFRSLGEQMADTRHDALVYLHGFANTFENTMERAAALHDAYQITKEGAGGSSGGPIRLSSSRSRGLPTARRFPRSSITRATATTPKLRAWQWRGV